MSLCGVHSSRVGGRVRVRACVCVQAGVALSLLLVLKKFLREAYRLADDRVAQYNPLDAALRAHEEKTPVSKVRPRRPRLEDEG